MSSTMTEAARTAGGLARLRIFGYVSVGLSIVSMVWVANATVAALDVETFVVAPAATQSLLGPGLIFTLIAHVAMLPMIVWALRTVDEARVLGTAGLVLCSVSTILLVSDWACLHDIVREHPAGLDISQELFVLRIGLAVHGVYLLFQIAMSASLITTLKNLQLARSTRSGESTFNAVHLLGVVCAGVGLTITARMFVIDLPARVWAWAVLPILCVVAAPYVLVFLIWLREAKREADSGLLDEKQKTDLMKGATTALLASIPITIGLFVIGACATPGPMSVLWLPSHLFASLLVFSASTLFFFRRP